MSLPSVPTGPNHPTADPTPATGPGRGPHEPPFVGREAELAGLLGQLGAALDGRGGVALLVGEPGIGKTRTAQRLAAAAQGRGGQVVWGRCFEGEWAPPFGPWVEAVGRLVGGGEAAWLRRELGSGAGTVAALVPAVRAVLPDLPAPAPLGAEEEAIRVQDAVASLVVAAAHRRPLLLVLDDLHWADAASLALLRYLGRFMGEAPLLVVGTYRGEEVDDQHRLAAVLADLRREVEVRSYQLGGLGRGEMAGLLARLAGEPVAPELAAAVHGETGGNPFFARELYRSLAEEERLEAGEAGLTLGRGGELPGGGVPEGVRQIVGRRLARLSEAANRMLGQAAIAADGIDFAVLLALTGMAEAELLDALDEALASGLLRAAGGGEERYEFVHAIVRHTLEAGWSPSRRVRLHRRLAESLERVHAGREGEHAAELAVQYHRSAALPGAGRGVRYAVLAAEAAKTAAAREGAARFLRIARDLTTPAETDATTRAGLLAKLAVAEAEALLLEDARGTVEAAVAAMAEAGVAAEAVAGFLGTVAAALEEGGAPVTAWRPLVERGLALVGESRGATWARLTLTLKPFAPLAGGPIQGARWLGSPAAAVAVARATGDEEDFARTVQAFDDRRPEETRALVERARGWQRPAATIRALTMAGADWLYHHGDLAQAIAVFEELLATARRHGAIVAEAEALIRLAIARVGRGEHGAARGLAAETAVLLARLGPGHHLRPSAAWIDALLADQLCDERAVWEGVGVFWEGYVLDPRAADNALVIDDAALAAYAHARAGRAADARRLLAALTPLLRELTPADWLLNGAVAFAAGALWTVATGGGAGGGARGLGEADVALARAYRGIARTLVAAGRGDYPGTSLDLTLARMAALLGDRAEAGERFGRTCLAAASSRRLPLRPLAEHDEALALLRLAPDGAEPARIAALLTSARAGFAELGMGVWVERVEALGREAAQRAARGGPVLPGGLTEREVDVLRLVAQGCSDREIGERLFLSPRTVNAHVRNMLRKTERGNRTELSVWGVELGVVSR